MHSVLDWMTSGDRRGDMHFYTGSAWECHSGDRVVAEIGGVAAYLRQLGIGRGDRVALVLPVCPEFPAFFFGVMAVGAIPTVIPPAGLRASEHLDHLAALLNTLGASAIVAEAITLDMLRVGLPGSRLPRHLIDCATTLPDKALVDPSPARDDEIAIIQFTSGSTSAARAVQLSARAVLAHVDMLRSGFIEMDQPGATHAFGSWLPMHHDMGLIGLFVSPVTRGCDVWLMRPEHFVRRPALWLELFGERGVSHSAIPNFAVERIVRLVSATSLENMDFSNWRTLVVGSDRINFSALRAFHRLLAPFGLRSDTIKPGYGMAETTLAVSMTGTEDRPSALRVRYPDTDIDAKVEILGTCDVLDPVLTVDPVTSEVVDGEHLVVSCGSELPGVRITVVNDERETLQDSMVGEIAVQSPALFSGYLDTTSAESAPEDILYTGDLGFRHAGDVYILGRIGNAAKVNGTYVMAEDLELALADRLMVNHDKVTVVLNDTGRTEGLAALVVFEQRINAEKVGDALDILRGSGLPPSNVAILILAPLAIPRTTSGKPRRRELWNRLESGNICGRELHIGADVQFFASVSEKFDASNA